MDSKKIKVLIVDDNRADFHLVHHMLESVNRAQFDLTWASSYEDAIENLRNPFDAALLDFRLGRYSGLDVLREVLSVGGETPVRFVAPGADGASPQAWADAIDAHLADPRSREAATRHAAAIRAKYAEDRMVAAYVDLIRSGLARPAGGRRGLAASGP